MRIASLLPSATEIVYALGLDRDLVGVTFECDYPPDPRRDRAVLVGGLWVFGVDGKMATYGACVLVAAALQWVLARGWRR